MILVLATFLGTGLVVVAAGIILGRSADRIAELTFVGRVWTGAVLLAAATSLPELVTDVSAVRLHTPDLGAGDLFGSSLSNMLILALIDFVPGQRVLKQATFNVALAACLAIGLNALGAAFVVLHSQRTFFGFHPESTLLLLIYVFGTRAIYRQGVKAEAQDAARQADPAQTPRTIQGLSLLRATTEFLIGALMIFLAAPAFARSAINFAQLSGLGASFVGTCLLGFSTALPEFVTSVTAVKLGAYDLAVGTLFGSSAFNMVVFFAMDMAYGKGSVFAALAPVHALSGSLAVVLMALGLAAIVYRSDRRMDLMEPGSGLMLASYGLAIWLVYLYAR